MSTLLHINVACCTVFVSFESEVKVSLKHVPQVSSVQEGLLKLSLFSLLSFSGLFTLSYSCFTQVLLLSQASCQHINMVLVGAQGPSTEAHSQVTLHDVEHDFLAGAALDVEFLDVVSPGVEAACSLHVDGSLNEVSHNFVG